MARQDAKQPLLRRPDEVAQSLQIGRSRVYEMISSQLLPSIRIGRTVRVPADKLRDWVKAQQEHGNETAP